MLRQIFEGPVDAWAVTIALTATLAAAWLAARVARRMTTAALRALLHDTVSSASPQVRRLLRVVTAAAFLLVVSIVLVPAFDLAGLQPRRGVHVGTIVDWALTSGKKLVLIAILAYALVRMTTLAVRRFEHEVSAGSDLDALERAKRARTLGSVIERAVTALVTAVALVMVLDLFGVNIGPVVAGAGIVGLAIGFGAQTLVRDVISGFFMILENQVRVGDVAAINGTEGLVEGINLRTIVLRDIEGTVHVFPNGAINTLANRSKDFSYYVVDLAVSYYDDTDKIAAAVREVGAALLADPAFGPAILAPIEILGIDAFGDWSLKMKARIKTVPLKQWEVGRELRRRIIKAFERQGFSIPFPVPATAARPAAHEGQ
ncbi:MAG TPA: mechanosensitive ion channel family protein [Burkholderiaceae bacterium]|nr:mechanosensitive ion channel family protein [Burkholderiaceae bacterium]